MNKIAICVGHSRRGDSGAVSVGGVTEWDFNRGIAYDLCAALEAGGIDAQIFDQYEGNGYGAAMSWLAGEIEAARCNAAVELHFNAASPSAHGYEYLHHANSKKGKKLATAFHDAQKQILPQMRSRGVKTPMNGRGGQFLSKTHCPASILEPFFGTNAPEWNFYSDEEPTLVRVYAEAIAAYYG